MDRKKQLQQLLRKTNALIEGMGYSVDSADNEEWKYISYKTFMLQYNHLVDEAVPLLPYATLINRFDMNDVPGLSNTALTSQKNYYEQAHSSMLLLKSVLETEIGYTEESSPEKA